MQFIFYAFLCFSFIQFCFYLGIFRAFSFAKKPTKNNEQQNIPVSVIICAHNEAENLKEFLPFFINQEYENFELLLINDASNDETLDVMESFKQLHPTKISIVDVVPNEQFWRNKKYALSLGIKSAKYEHLLFSDADCKPVSNQWISEITSKFTEQKSIVLGYGAYEKINNSWLNKLIRFETLFTAIQYFSYTKIGLPYMGVGRNLAYTKSLFFESSGFANHMHIRSGDDDLFVNKNATNQNISLSYFTDSFTLSKPKATFKEWIHQKRRHTTTASHYKPIHKILLGVFYSSQLLFWLLVILLLATTFQWKIVVGVLLLRSISQYLIIGASAKKLNEKDLVLWAPILEIFLIFMQLFIFIKNIIAKPTHW
jgi:glycosyltransferase involved in cell wall biosynthesis|tara:strand:- start:404 stop:1513 length:1110 start_codon:yes stop_codon:yes gene_type:complete